MMSRRSDFMPTCRWMICASLAMAMSLCGAGAARAQDAGTPKAEDPAVKKDQPPADKPTERGTTLTPRRPRTPSTTSISKEKTETPAETPTATPSGPNPKAEVPAPDHDFGDVWIGGKLEHAYEIRNVGEVVLDITSVKPSCGCTLAGEYDKKIEPGKTGRIPVSMDSKKLHGSFSKSVRVTTNDPANQNLNLTLKGNVKHYVNVEPSSVNFGQIKPGETKDLTVKLTNNSEEPLQLTMTDPLPTDTFTVELKEIAPGKEFELCVKSKPPYQEGHNNAAVTIKTNNPNQPELQVRVLSNALARLNVEPKQIMIARPAATETTQTIKIGNYGDTPIHLLSATIDDENLTLETKEVEPGKQYEVAVKVPPNYQPPATGKNLTLKFDDSEKPEVLVSVRGRITPPKPAETMVGQQAPAVEFTTHGGATFNTASIQDQALVLKFYATWCGFCKKSMPGMEQVYQEYKDKGVRFVNVNLDDRLNPEDDATEAKNRKKFTVDAALAKLKELGVTYDVAFDPEKKVGGQFKVQSYPTMFVLDKSGKVRNVNAGAIQGAKIDEFKKQLDAILTEQSAKAADGTPTQPATASGTE